MAIRYSTLTRNDDGFDSIAWAFEVHVKQPDNPACKSAVLNGNEDAPEDIEFYVSENPLVTDKPLFTWAPMVTLYDGLSGFEFAQVPADCVTDCTHQGPCDDDVEFWVKKLDFNPPRDEAIAALRETGAWDKEELAQADDDTIAQRLLWVLCGDAREELRADESDEWVDRLNADIDAMEGDN